MTYYTDRPILNEPGFASTPFLPINETNQSACLSSLEGANEMELAWIGQNWPELALFASVLYK